VGFRKPRPEAFQRILKLLDLDTSEVVMIGNSMEADIAGARPLGIRTIRVMFDESADRDGADPDLTVFTVADVVPAIRRVAAGR
jgi:FMN phosphatase YigB (HAD superfamily)